MADPFEKLSDEAREKRRKKDIAHFTKPMLARLTDKRFSNPGWIFERKLDGERVLAFRDAKKVRLMSRNEKDITDTYPEVAEALEQHGPDRFIADGEVVAFEGDVTSFGRLQQRMKITDADEARASGVAVYYYLFDLLYLDDWDVAKLELRDRKRLLRAAFDFKDPLRFTQHRNEEGEAAYEEACRKGWEGVIAKDAAGAYAHGRSSKWLKFKCVRDQEFVIGGFTDPEGSRKGFGALLIGYYDDGKLRYAGKVGTGYDDGTLESLRKRMNDLEVDAPPFDAEHLPRKGVHWIEPKLVGEFAFTEVTSDHKLRHPRFKGLRRDKNPKNVHLEAPEGS